MLWTGETVYIQWSWTFSSLSPCWMASSILPQGKWDKLEKPRSLVSELTTSDIVESRVEMLKWKQRDSEKAHIQNSETPLSLFACRSQSASSQTYTVQTGDQRIFHWRNELPKWKRSTNTDIQRSPIKTVICHLISR